MKMLDMGGNKELAEWFQQYDLNQENIATKY
jgi:hypothetical protein